MNGPLSRYLKKRLASSKQVKVGNQKGVAATEFALLLPVMLVMIFGSMEVSELIIVERKNTLATSTLADLASQVEVLTCPEIAQLATITRQVFDPYSGDPAEMIVGNIVIDDDEAVVEWSKRMVTDSSSPTKAMTCEDVPGSSPWARGRPVDVDLGIFAQGGGGLVFSEIKLPHSTLGTAFIENGIVMSSKHFIRPRKSLKLKLCIDTTPGVTGETCGRTT